MALARKGSRIIVVDGARYRWTVAPDDEPGLAIVAELADGPGQRMVTWYDHGTIIAPGLAERAIRHALAQGWEPWRRGTEVVYRREP